MVGVEKIVYARTEEAASLLVSVPSSFGPLNSINRRKYSKGDILL
jgi:hypothetical protein